MSKYYQRNRILEVRAQQQLTSGSQLLILIHSSDSRRTASLLNHLFRQAKNPLGITVAVRERISEKAIQDVKFWIGQQYSTALDHESQIHSFPYSTKRVSDTEAYSMLLKSMKSRSMTVDYVCIVSEALSMVQLDWDHHLKSFLDSESLPKQSVVGCFALPASFASETHQQVFGITYRTRFAKRIKTSFPARVLFPRLQKKDELELVPISRMTHQNVPVVAPSPDLCIIRVDNFAFKHQVGSLLQWMKANGRHLFYVTPINLCVSATKRRYPTSGVVPNESGLMGLVLSDFQREFESRIKYGLRYQRLAQVRLSQYNARKKIKHKAKT